jgi:putative ABC transport system substrate-binding protein
MQRREFITLLLGGAAAAWPRAAKAQQPSVPMIGFLDTASADGFAPMAAAFRQGLAEAGYVAGRNVAIEYVWAEGQNERMRAAAADLVRRQAAVIFAGGVSAIEAAKAATTTTPIVFRSGTDPVAAGFVPSLSRPAGNLTGVSTLAGELEPKRLEMLRELLPGTSIAALFNPTNPSNLKNKDDLLAAARTLGLQLHLVPASTDREFDTAFTLITQMRAAGLVIQSDAFFNSHGERLGALTLRHALPAIFQYREFIAGGGLMSYGSRIPDSYRLAGIYTGRILNGEKPSDLPVQQATTVELIINMKTAKALGLTFPLTLLGRADEVIE